MAVPKAKAMSFLQVLAAYLRQMLDYVFVPKHEKFQNGPSLHYVKIETLITNKKEYYSL